MLAQMYTVVYSIDYKFSLFKMNDDFRVIAFCDVFLNWNF